MYFISSIRACINLKFDSYIFIMQFLCNVYSYNFFFTSTFIYNGFARMTPAKVLKLPISLLTSFIMNFPKLFWLHLFSIISTIILILNAYNKYEENPKNSPALKKAAASFSLNLHLLSVFTNFLAVSKHRFLDKIWNILWLKSLYASFLFLFLCFITKITNAIFQRTCISYV